MKPFQQRVIAEKADLDLKLSSLTNFFRMVDFNSLDEEEQSRMIEQSVAMNDYSRILGERIAAFN